VLTWQVRISEFTIALYPPDARTGATYTQLDAMPERSSSDPPRPHHPASGLLICPEPGSMGKPLLALTLRRFGYDYFMRLHDMSMVLTVRRHRPNSRPQRQHSPLHQRGSRDCCI
jgi:hypothetical protein